MAVKVFQVFMAGLFIERQSIVRLKPRGTYLPTTMALANFLVHKSS